MPDQPSPRRRFQFRLRTLMIVVTLLAVACAHVAHEAKIVRERRNWLVAHLFAASSFPPHLILLAQGSAEHNPSVIRLLLGDNSYKFIPVPASAPASVKEEAIILFPESKVMAWEIPGS